jgi:mannose-6-phosphate isomerase-like protein (cupin superfamily)
MTLSKQVSIRRLESIHGGMAEFYTPQSSNETMLVKVPAKARDDLFVHRYQTDQILVVRGSFVLVVLENRRYRYIAMSEDCPQVVTIPPGVAHGAINPNNKDCWLVNAVLRHGASNPRDYQPIKKPFEYDLAAAEKALMELNRIPTETVLSIAA